MDEEDEFTPKDLEVLPFKTVLSVHDIVHFGITRDSTDFDCSNSSNPGVSKNVKKYSPKNRRFRKEAIFSMNRIASLFVLYITTIAESIAKNNRRSSVFDKDILEALKQCMFYEVESQINDLQQKENNENQDQNHDLDHNMEDLDHNNAHNLEDTTVEDLDQDDYNDIDLPENENLEENYDNLDEDEIELENNSQ
ncbi:hypothetical protein TpMuguga_04g00379 [Theileria parva strain Muguga]|uniref:Transcription factor CBF/NF-Y/archaeal histone domain-containing protein n=1 Tax=Theileria parva TaxID=5875 RepID=Q4N2H0_THEPA|nr:uncharacterized protein TpMuguga_04g00379 [Theileria parva strain Muguga]EAN31731.1 hypothetical protein TpMuguga_04g00379 [Theileria parva strain Muguga]|eukprot:XP_764014.1 hypothetical protein [Theileria parva strain Muguga]